MSPPSEPRRRGAHRAQVCAACFPLGLCPLPGLRLLFLRRGAGATCAPLPAGPRPRRPPLTGRSLRPAPGRAPSPPTTPHPPPDTPSAPLRPRRPLPLPLLGSPPPHAAWLGPGTASPGPSPHRPRPRCPCFLAGPLPSRAPPPAGLRLCWTASPGLLPLLPCTRQPGPLPRLAPLSRRYLPPPPRPWLGPVTLFAHLLVHPPALADPGLLGGGWMGEGDRWVLLAHTGQCEGGEWVSLPW